MLFRSLETVSPKIAFAIADDIGATPLWEQATAMGIAYYSAGVDGLTMIAIGDSCDYEVMTQYDTVLRKNRAE